MKARIFLLTVFFVFAGNVAFASAYWLDVKGNGRLGKPVTIEVCYGSMDEKGIRQRDTGKELKLTGDFKLWLINPEGRKEQLELKMLKDSWQASFMPSLQGTYRIIANNDRHPVVDRSATGGENVRPFDYLSAVYQVGEALTKITDPLQKLDIITRIENGFVIVKAFKNDSIAVAGTKLRVFNPDNWERELVLDANGEAKFYPTIKGLYIIRQDWLEPVSGEFNGVKYARSRHRCNFYLLFK